MTDITIGDHTEIMKKEIDHMIEYIDRAIVLLIAVTIEIIMIDITNMIDPILELMMNMIITGDHRMEIMVLMTVIVDIQKETDIIDTGLHITALHMMITIIIMEVHLMEEINYFTHQNANMKIQLFFFIHYNCHFVFQQQNFNSNK